MDEWNSMQMLVKNSHRVTKPQKQKEKERASRPPNNNVKQIYQKTPKK